MPPPREMTNDAAAQSRAYGAPAGNVPTETPENKPRGNAHERQSLHAESVSAATVAGGRGSGVDGGAVHGPIAPPVTITRAEDPDHWFAAAAFVDKHHSYVQWTDRPSRKLYWSIWQRGERVGVFGLGSAYSKPAAVAALMARHSIAFNGLANNFVFAMSPQATRNTGTLALALIRRDAVRWWSERYGDELCAFQTFIEPPRTGALYRADNWIQIGVTSGDSAKTMTLAPGESVPDGWSYREPVFADGSVRRYAEIRVTTTKKLILARVVSGRERRRALAQRMTKPQGSLFGSAA